VGISQCARGSGQAGGASHDSSRRLRCRNHSRASGAGLGWAARDVLAVAVFAPVPGAVDVENLYSASGSTWAAYLQTLEKISFIVMWHKNCFITDERL
jgi:hypothetical protein